MLAENPHTFVELVADFPLAAPRRRNRRDRAAWLALALLLHFLVFAALVLVLPEETKPPATPAPAEVALLFEGGSSPAKPAPPADRVAPSKAPSPIPGVDAETTTAAPPPAIAAAAPPPPQTPPTPVTPNVPEAATPPAPLGTAPRPVAPPSAPTEPAVPASRAPPALPDVEGTVPVPPPVSRPPEDSTTANPKPPQLAATPPPPAVATREPPRPPRVTLHPAPPRVTANGFPTTLMPSLDLSQRSSVTRNAAVAPPSASHSNASSDVRGGEALGADWLAELSAYVERHKRYPEQAAENNEEGDSTISIVVERDGRVFGRDVDLVRRSGSQFLDMGLMSMFRDKQLPPFPPGAPHDRETIQITMHYYLIRR